MWDNELRVTLLPKINAQDLLAVASGQVRLFRGICCSLEYLLLALTTDIIDKLKV